MASSSNKTLATMADVDAYIDTIADARQQEDARAIRDMLERVSDEPAVLWGSSIIGFGRYHYRYESGREGEMCRIGFSPRKGQIVLYLVDGFPDHAGLMARLGKHKTGKSCLHIKRLADVNEGVLEALCRNSLAMMAKRYPNRT